MIYPEKLTFNGEYFQITKINSFIESIFFIKNEIEKQKNRQRSEKTSNVGLVTKTSVYSNTFIDDLVRLSLIKNQLQTSFLSEKLF